MPIWPGDSAWSAIYEYYATLTGVPIVNGYNPVPRQRYVTEVFEPLRSLNVGELRAAQHALLRDWNVSHIVLHQDLFPRKVSRSRSAAAGGAMGNSNRCGHTVSRSSACPAACQRATASRLINFPSASLWHPLATGL